MYFAHLFFDLKVQSVALQSYLCHQRWRTYSVSAKKRINSFVLLSTFSNFAASNAASLLVLGNSNHPTIDINET